MPAATYEPVSNFGEVDRADAHAKHAVVASAGSAHLLYMVPYDGSRCTQTGVHDAFEIMSPVGGPVGAEHHHSVTFGEGVLPIERAQAILHLEDRANGRVSGHVRE